MRRAHSLKAPTGRDERPIIIVENPSRSFYFPVTPEDVREALSRLPEQDTRALTHLWFRRATQRAFEEGEVPLAEFVRGSGVCAVVLYPWPRDRQLFFGAKAIPAAVRRFYAPWGPEVIGVPGGRALQFTEEALRRFYLEHLLVHEVGHLVDSLRPGRQRGVGRRSAESFADDYALRWSRLGTKEAANEAGPP